MSKCRRSMRVKLNDMKYKLDRKFKSEHITGPCGRRFCKWQTDWHMSILYWFNMPLDGASPWYIIYDNDISDLVDKNFIWPQWSSKQTIKFIIYQLETEPEKLITKPKSVLILERKLNMDAKLHSSMFGIWHITDMEYNWNDHTYNQSSGISIINNSFGTLWACYGNEKLFEVTYDERVYGGFPDSGLYPFEVHKIIKKYKN